MYYIASYYVFLWIVLPANYSHDVTSYEYIGDDDNNDNNHDDDDDDNHDDDDGDYNKNDDYSGDDDDDDYYDYIDKIYT